MSQQYPYGVGLQNVGSYQVSGIPYVTSSIAAPASSGNPSEVSFPDVTQRIVVSNVNTADYAASCIYGDALATMVHLRKGPSLVGAPYLPALSR